MRFETTIPTIVDQPSDYEIVVGGEYEAAIYVREPDGSLQSLPRVTFEVEDSTLSIRAFRVDEDGDEIGFIRLDVEYLGGLAIVTDHRSTG